jgi:uncharacterized protein
LAAARLTVGAAPLAVPRRSSAAGYELTPVFDIARIEPTGEAVIAGKAAPNATVELLRNGSVHDRAIADHSGQFVMVPPRLPSGDYELTLRSRQPDGTETTSKQSVTVTSQPNIVAAPTTLDKQDAGINSPRLPPGNHEPASRSKLPDGIEATSNQSATVTSPPKIVAAPTTLNKQEAGIDSPRLPPGDNELTSRSEAPDGTEATSKQSATVTSQPKIVAAPTTLDTQEAGIAAYQRGDFDAALRLFQPLAEHGDASAQSNLGVMYEQGRGVAQNYREAMKWFRLAALQGNASAQSNLGVMYYKGQGIAQDYVEAMKWYRMAAEQRNLEAQFNLGVMYGEGRGVAQDRVRAHMWFNLAAAVSNDGNAKLAAKNRDLVTKGLTREQLFRAQEMAHRCEASSFKNCD